MRTRDEQIVMDYKEVSHGNICRWEVPDPFVMSFQGGGSISFFKDGRIDYNIVDPNGAAKDLVSFLETHYQEHILEAERRAEQRVRAEIALDSERLDWISRTPDFFFELLQDQPGNGDIMVITGDMVFTGSTFRSAIDAAREAQE